MYDVEEYSTFLKGLKQSPGRVFVAAITGPAQPVEVIIEQSPVGETSFVLSPACTGTSGEAAPSVRLQAFLDAFPGRSSAASICNQDFQPALTEIGARIGKTLTSTCLQGTIHDFEPATSGVQYQCEVFQVIPIERLAALPACDDPADPAGSMNHPAI